MNDYIICVDDNPSVISALLEQLDRKFRERYFIEGVQSAEEAKELILELRQENKSVALVVVDQIMPGMKGDVFLEWISNFDPSIFKILLTAHAGLKTAINVINKAHVHKFIEKPWQVDDLNMTIQNLLKQYELEKQNNAYVGILKIKNEQLERLQQIVQKLNKIADEEEFINLLRNKVRKFFNVRYVGVYLCHAGLFSQEFKNHFDKDFPIDIGEVEAFHKYIVQRNRAQRFQGNKSSDPHGLLPLSVLKMGTLAVSIASGEDILGTLILIEKLDQERFDELDEYMATIVASQAGSVLENIRLTQEKNHHEKLALIGRMASKIIHDFKNPMTVIKGYAGLLSQKIAQADQMERFASIITNEVDQMVRMTNELLEFSRGEQTSYHFARCEMRKVVEELIADVQQEATKNNVVITTEMLFEGSFTMDWTKMKRALINLLRNAIEEMQDGGSINIRVEKKWKNLLISIADTGKGIPIRIRDNVFEPFISYGKEEGTGLGTTIAQSIITRHGGKVFFETKTGKGTTFHIELPERKAIE